jgi:hypothetical protein
MKKNQYFPIKRSCLSVMLIATALMMTSLPQGYSQNPATVVTNGTKVLITAGSSLNSTENFILNSGGKLDVQGTLVLKKNLINSNAAADSLGTGDVVFSGTTAQSISGTNIIKNLKLDNATGLALLGNTRVFGTLTLTNGLVSLGTSNLVLGPAASVAGTPAAANMVVAPGPGELRKEFASAGSFTFPVGDATGTAEYSPVTLSFNSGTFAAGSYVGVGVVDAAYPGTAGSYLSRYWTVTPSGITDYTCNPVYQYVPADVTGTESDIFCFKVDPALPWIAYNASNPGAHTINAVGLSSLGIFTGNLGNGTVPPAIRSLQDKTISTGPECADATQTLMIAGNGTTYVVTGTPAGSVNHIAGTNIVYYPGTKVELGGYMHGYISTTFCSPYIHPGATAPLISGVEAPGTTGNPSNSFFKIYPNPTLGKFTLELNGDVTAAKVHVEIFGVLGDRILSKDMQVERKQEFSLAEKPTGVYVIHVSSGVDSETQKIIKR